MSPDSISEVFLIRSLCERRALPALLAALSAVCLPAARQESVAPARRIVSLAPNLTEMLFAIGAGGQVVGVTDFCDDPAEARRLPKVGGFINPNPEAVIALAPDLIVATPNVGNRPFVERMMRAGARVEVVPARNLEEIFPALESLGRVTGHETEAAGLVRSLREKLRAAQARVADLPRPRALLVIQVDPLVAAGPGSYPHDLLVLAGGRSIVPEGTGAYPTLSLEWLVVAAPDVVIQTRMDAPGDSGGLLRWWDRWVSIPAVKGGRVFTVPGDALLRPGPRVVEGVELLIRLLHGPRPGDSSPTPGPRREGQRPGGAPASGRLERYRR